MARFVSIALVVLVWLWAPPASSQETRPYGQGLLWRIEGTNAPASYVFGTVHITDPRVQTLVARMLETVGPLNSISLELVPGPEVQAAAGQRMFIQSGPSLSQLVGTRLFADAVEAAAPYGLDANVLERFTPWAVAVTLSVPESEMRAQAAGNLISELILADHATRNGIALHDLETIDEQLGLFEQLAPDTQVEMLRQAVQYSPILDQLFTQMVEAYLAQDLNAILRLMEEMTAGDQADLLQFYETKLIAGRNRSMVERMQPRLAEGNALIAVGALHLPDEAGILRLLERRGYTIVPMSTRRR